MMSSLAGCAGICFSDPSALKVGDEHLAGLHVQPGCRHVCFALTTCGELQPGEGFERAVIEAGRRRRSYE